MLHSVCCHVFYLSVDMCLFVVVENFARLGAEASHPLLRESGRRKSRRQSQAKEWLFKARLTVLIYFIVDNHHCCWCGGGKETHSDVVVWLLLLCSYFDENSFIVEFIVSSTVMLCAFRLSFSALC